MQASTIDTPTAGQFGTIFVAIELSQKSWLVKKRRASDVPTIYHRSRCTMVGALRFAHPTKVIE